MEPPASLPRGDRIAAGVPLTHLAKAMGISAPYLLDMEFGRRGVTAAMEQRYVIALDKLRAERTQKAVSAAAADVI